MSAQLGEHVSSSALSAYLMARAGVAAHNGVAHEVEYVEYEDVWWARQWDPIRQWYCWWLVDDDGTWLGPGIWRPPWEFWPGR